MAGAVIRISILANAARARAEMDSVSDRSGRMGERLAAVGEKVKGATKALVKMGGTLASVASLAGPLTAGLLAVGNAVNAAGQSAAALAPLIAFAPAVIGGLQFLKFTLAGIGKQMGEALKPLGTAFRDAQRHAGILASAGLPKLAQAFKRVNFPTIARGMDSIGRSTGRSVTMFGRWVNSAAGVKLVGDVTDGVSRAFAKAAPAITKAAIALLNMTNRAGVADRLSAIGTTVAKLADKFTAWANSITAGDIDGALKRVGNAAGIFSGKIQAIKDVFNWLATNQEQIKGFTDALAALGLALSIYTLNPVGIAIAAFTLLSNHWTETKAVFAGVSEWWSGVWVGLKADPGLQALGTTVMESFRKIQTALQPFVADLMAKVVPALRSLGQVVLKDVVPAYTSFIAAVTPVVTWLIGILGPVFNKVMVGIVNIVRGAFQILAGIFNVIAALLTGNWSRLWQGIKQILSGAWTIIKAVVSAGWAAVKAVFSAGVGAVAAIARRLGGAVKSAVGGLGGLLINAGRSVIDGFIGGITSGFDRVRGKLGELTSMLPSWKGPATRDRRILVGSGKLVMGGFRTGLESQYSAIQASLGGFTGGLGASTSVGGTVSVDAAGAPAWAAELLTLLRQPTRLEIASTGTRADDALLELIRDRVRVKGGKASVLGVTA